MADSKDPAAELERLSANPRELSVGGETIQVRPLRFLELIRALKYLTPILEVVDKVDMSSNDLGEVSKLLEVAPEAMLKIAGLSTGKEEQWFDRLEADEGLDVFIAVFEVNKDFFVQRLGPKLANLRPATQSGKPAKP